MRVAFLILIPAALAVTPGPSAAVRWAAEGRLGAAWNLPMPLTVRQEGAEELGLTARWDTRALRFPLYYAARGLAWQGTKGWALDLTHHKIHLREPPAEIQAFAVSHGYNLITLQRVVRGADLTGGFGAGVVVAHPENEVRGKRLDEAGGLLGSGYYVAGPSVSALLGTSPPARGGAYASAEARLTYSWARMPVADGSATVPNLALHVTLGLGWIER